MAVSSRAVLPLSYQHQWIVSNNLSKGGHLRTPDSSLAVADGGTTPKVHDGWMWDLTVPGNNGHDFYVSVAAVAVLVHNCGVDPKPGPAADGSTLEEYAGANRGANQDSTPRFVSEYTSPSGARYYGRATPTALKFPVFCASFGRFDGVMAMM
jgi:hypothetical protein